MMEIKGARREKPTVAVESVKVSKIEELTPLWNGVVEGLESAERYWELFQEKIGEIPREEIQNAPMEIQKATVRFRKAKFVVMLSRFIDYYRAFGGLEKMRIKGVEVKENGR